MIITEIFRALQQIFEKISLFLGIEWAPINVPLKRRLQAISAGTWIFLILFGEFLTIIATIKLLYTEYWLIVIIYAIWMLNDIEICHRGGRPFEWVRNWPLWKYYSDYFPVKLVKTAELDPSKNYLFACFPHGIICYGIFACFATNSKRFYEMFPGMTSNLVTLGGHFIIPFFRDFLLALGLCAPSQQNLMHLLNLRNNKGKCVALAVGGAAEALHAYPGKYCFNIRKRKGFIRVAMTSGAHLVPVISFGEVDVYEQVTLTEESFLRKFQLFIKKYTGVCPAFFSGRGFFQYSYGLLPYRKPITTVVGAPMDVKKVFEPTPEEINEVHAQFMSRLEELFEAEKSKYIEDYENVKLVLT